MKVPAFVHASPPNDTLSPALPSTVRICLPPSTAPTPPSTAAALIFSVLLLPVRSMRSMLSSLSAIRAVVRSSTRSAPDNASVSVPVPPSARRKVRSDTTSRSSPAPAWNTSAPPPPVSTSSPLPPISISAADVPVVVTVAPNAPPNTT